MGGAAMKRLRSSTLQHQTQKQMKKMTTIMRMTIMILLMTKMMRMTIMILLMTKMMRMTKIVAVKTNLISMIFTWKLKGIQHIAQEVGLCASGTPNISMGFRCGMV